ncbi:Protein kinase C-binding protein NELL1 [Fukomys damarensis]|uniref:Protein kinase C-binding protein NELL1 n=1 Tax=Fukomys damarensis TaxID=885580 RepID=A0A091DX01_FUKDA|nr:Protein kinase C-binding protein NELL1 [Fukomys damarensis]
MVRLKLEEDGEVHLCCKEMDIDECAAKMHYCHANTVCVNLPGLYRCDCVPGYIRVDDFSCTGKLNLSVGMVLIYFRSPTCPDPQTPGDFRSRRPHLSKSL